MSRHAHIKRAKVLRCAGFGIRYAWSNATSSVAKTLCTCRFSRERRRAQAICSGYPRGKK